MSLIMLPYQYLVLLASSCGSCTQHSGSSAGHGISQPLLQVIVVNEGVEVAHELRAERNWFPCNDGLYGVPAPVVIQFRVHAVVAAAARVAHHGQQEALAVEIEAAQLLASA